MTMRAVHPGELKLSTEILGRHRFLFVRFAPQGAHAVLAEAIDALGAGMENMHEAEGHATEEGLRRGRYQLLRAAPELGAERDVAHPELSRADALVRLEAAGPGPLDRFEQGLRALVEPGGGAVETLAGEHRPRSYTSHAMAQFAYAPALAPLPGARCPMGVVTPLSKTEAWWTMDWMRRESFFLPRFDVRGRLLAKGHALAAADGIPCIVRRTVHAPGGYGTHAAYDFVAYFEFAEEHAPTFRAVMAALRDREQNPEWAYVREGPEWWGRRVASAAALVSAPAGAG